MSLPRELKIKLQRVTLGFQSISKNTVTIDAFPRARGCSEKRAAGLVILYKDLQKLDEAVGHVKSATTNQKLIIWDKREITMVTIDESSPEERSVRVAMTTSRPTNGIETRISTL